MGRGCLMTDSSIRQPISRQHLLFIPFVRDTFFYSVAHISFFFFLPLSLLSNGIFLHIYALENTKKKRCASSLTFLCDINEGEKRIGISESQWRPGTSFVWICSVLGQWIIKDWAQSARARVLYFLLRRISTPLLSFSYLTKEKLTSFFAHPSTPSKTKILKPETCVGSAFFISSSRAN